MSLQFLLLLRFLLVVFVVSCFLLVFVFVLFILLLLQLLILVVFFLLLFMCLLVTVFVFSVSSVCWLCSYYFYIIGMFVCCGVSSSLLLRVCIVRVDHCVCMLRVHYCVLIITNLFLIFVCVFNYGNSYYRCFLCLSSFPY